MISSIVLSINLSLYPQGNSRQKKDSIEEEKIIALILDLKEVKDISSFVDSVSEGKSRVFVAILNTPTKKDNYYWVRVAERRTDKKENESSFTPTIFHFFVTPVKYEIRFYDTVLDKTLELSEWRKQKKHIK